MEYKIFLFPYKTRVTAILLLILSAVCTYFYFWGGKPEIFNIKIFALVSVYLETRYFVIAQTNVLDEMAAILFITGIALFSFSKLKKEMPGYNQLRVKALFYSIFITLIIWILCFLLIYGIAIFLASAVLFIIFLITYNLLFYFSIIRFKRLVNSATSNGNNTPF